MALERLKREKGHLYRMVTKEAVWICLEAK